MRTQRTGDQELSKVELFELIRREPFLHKKGIRRIAQALGNALPPGRKAPVLEVIDGWVSTDWEAPRRHTGRRIYARLKAEHVSRGAESRVRVYVGRRRGEFGVAEVSWNTQ